MIRSNQTIILIPTYNEAANIASTIDQIFAEDRSLSVMVLDDNSPDGTAAVVEGKISTYPNLRVVKRTQDRGFAPSYIDGFRRVLSENMFQLVITMDADFSHEPTEIPALIAAINNGADVVIGSRYASGQAFPDITWWRRILSRLANGYIQLILHIPVTDCTSGFIAIRTAILKQIDFNLIRTDGYGFLFGLKYEASRLKAHIAEHPVRWPNRHQGKSKMTLRRVIESFLLPWKIRWGTYRDFKSSEPITRN